MKSTALEKRIKRRITARDHSFFVSTSPGLEKVCLKELKKLLPENQSIKSIDGGIEFTGTVVECYRANLHLRTATRILMRIKEFTATGFKDLERHAADIPWELYLHHKIVPEIHVTARKSRLYHSDAIAERFRACILARFMESAGLNSTCKAASHQQVFVRAFNDRFVVSMDSSGDLLYRRGLKTLGGKAPIRETLAAGCLLLAGYEGKKPMVDPMCGTGSFSLEAAMMAKNIPPGWYREFAFQGWPCFRKGAWKHLRREAEKEINGSGHGLVMASDADDANCKRLAKHINEVGFSDLIRVETNDLFNIKPEQITNKKGIVLVNPPYGLRLGTKNESEELVNRIFAHFLKAYKGWTVGILSPFDSFMKTKAATFKKYNVTHGGLKLFFITAKIR